MSKPKRILLYGFGPYRQFRDNITAKIVQSLPRQPGLRKVVFPARFSRKQFVDALKRHNPDVVLGLGQSSRRRIEVELQAKNRRRSSKAAKAKTISGRGPARLKTTLDVKIERQVGKSTNAGDYVCNFSMYVMLAHIRRVGTDVPYGFIHIPYDHDRVKARRSVAKILRCCRKGQV
jgi:pyroglutamyl-peptidase